MIKVHWVRLHRSGGWGEACGDGVSSGKETQRERLRRASELVRLRRDLSIPSLMRRGCRPAKLPRPNFDLESFAHAPIEPDLQIYQICWFGASFTKLWAQLKLLAEVRPSLISCAFTSQFSRVDFYKPMPRLVTGPTIQNRSPSDYPLGAPFSSKGIEIQLLGRKFDAQTVNMANLAGNTGSGTTGFSLSFQSFSIACHHLLSGPKATLPYASTNMQKLDANSYLYC